MSGDARNYSHRGIIPRAMQHVFREVDMRSDRTYNIAVSYLEIYNESLRDLLAEDPAASDSLAILDDATNTVVSLLRQGKGNTLSWAQHVLGTSGTAIQLQERSSSDWQRNSVADTCCGRFQGGACVRGSSLVRSICVRPDCAVLRRGAVQVRGLTKVTVSSEEEALRQFFLGEQARSTAQHALNTNSSRSHVLFTLHIEMRASAEAEERALLSKLHLVDLAGAEGSSRAAAVAGCQFAQPACRMGGRECMHCALRADEADGRMALAVASRQACETRW